MHVYLGEDLHSRSFIALNVILDSSSMAERKPTINSCNPSESGFNFQGHCWEKNGLLVKYSQISSVKIQNMHFSGMK